MWLFEGCGRLVGVCYTPTLVLFIASVEVL